MRRSWIQLYAPFIALAALQAVIIVAAPSTAPERDRLGSLDPLEVGAGSFGSEDLAVDPATSQPIDPATGQPVGSAGGAEGGASGGTGGGDAGAAGAGGGGAGGAPAGDTSHCKGGRQHDVIYNAPPCRPKFVGDNGGATYKPTFRR